MKKISFLIISTFIAIHASAGRDKTVDNNGRIALQVANANASEKKKSFKEKREELRNRKAKSRHAENDNSQDAEKKPETEKTPKTDPQDFERVTGTKAKKNKDTEEIWVRDQLHKDHYEVYRNKREFKKGTRDRVVFNDGRLWKRL